MHWLKYQSWKHSDLQSSCVYQFAIKFQDLVVPQNKQCMTATLEKSDVPTACWSELTCDQLFFIHSVNCYDRVSVKIDHGSVNRPPTALMSTRLFKQIFLIQILLENEGSSLWTECVEYQIYWRVISISENFSTAGVLSSNSITLTIQYFPKHTSYLQTQ